jgi:hypothetical protein
MITMIITITQAVNVETLTAMIPWCVILPTANLSNNPPTGILPSERSVAETLKGSQLSRIP